MTTQLLALIAAYLRLPPGDTEALEDWRRRVREAFPYERPVLTVKLGEIIERGKAA